MIIFMDYCCHNGLDDNDTDFWSRYGDMPRTGQMVDAWILGLVLGAKGFQNSIFRALVNTGFNAYPDDLGKVWSATPDGKKAGLPALIMDTLVSDLIKKDSDHFLKRDMKSCGKEPFMVEVFMSLVQKLKATQTWIHQVRKRGGSSSSSISRSWNIS